MQIILSRKDPALSVFLSFTVSDSQRTSEDLRSAAATDRPQKTKDSGYLLILRFYFVRLFANMKSLIVVMTSLLDVVTDALQT